MPRSLIALAVVLLASASSVAADKLQYNRDIRPIFAETCFSCHGQDSAARKAKLRLDVREAAIEKGAITPSKVDESEMVARLFLADDDEQRMPPPSSHKKLTALQKLTLKQWIAEGAEYQPHWAFIPTAKPGLPKLKNAAWAKNPIDALVLAELEKRGLTPAPEADRRTLARRAALDVIGLPPNPADVEAFVNDKSADAYEKYLDKLLASPHWGEHRGRYWLDAARYGDTHGIHFDNYREMYSYRDWVIRAFNANQRFDQFTIEQLAGDLLPEPSIDQLTATGFNRNNITTNEGGAINEEYLVLYTRDRTETASTVFLGLTTGCAVCHDHKFDPVSQKEFYQLSAFFNNTTQGAMDGNIRDTPPIVFVPSLDDRPKWATFEKQLKEARAKIDARKAMIRPKFDAFLKEQTTASAAEVATENGIQVRAALDGGKGTAELYTAANATAALKLPAGTTWKPGPFGGEAVWVTPKETGPNALEFPKTVGDFEHTQAFSYGAWVLVPQRGQNAGILSKMDNSKSYRGYDLYLENDKFAAHIVDTWPKLGFKVTTTASFNPNNWHHVFVTYDGRGPAGLKIYVNGESQALTIFGDDRTLGNAGEFKAKLGTIKTDVPFTVGRRTGGQQVKGVAIQDLRLYSRSLAAGEVKDLVVATKIAGLIAGDIKKRKPAEVNEIFEWWIAAKDPESTTLSKDYQALKSQEAAFKARGTIAHVSFEKPSMPEAFVLNRGEYDQRKDKVAPGTPAALPPMPADLPRNRLGLAKWLLRPEQPLMARVTVNRFWSELFGTGLVRTAGDFGISGELPSHPELLDHLAIEFRDLNWDVKAFFKMVLLSNTYQQSAATTPEKLEKDSQNRYLSRGPRFRMDAEMVRDYALTASGLLSSKIGGRSVRPYQPIGVWEAVAMPGSDTRNYKPDDGESLYRRSLYTFWKRAAPPASMEIFNAPNRETCAVRRDRTNTPLQALVTLNDVQFIEAARHLAQATLKAEKDTAARLQSIARRILARPFTDKESAIVERSLSAMLAEYKAKPAEAKKLLAVGDSKPDATLDAGESAAWTMLVNQLMNLDEVLCK